MSSNINNRSVVRRSPGIHSAAAFLLLAALLIAGCKGHSSGSAVVQPVTPAFSIVALSEMNAITVSWSVVSGAQSYRLYRSTTTPVSTTTSTFFPLDSSTSSYRDTSVSAGTRYYYVLTSTIAGVEGSPSIEVSAVPNANGTVSGTVRYEDKRYNQTGFIGTYMLPVRYATIEAVNASTLAVLASGHTDSQGAFSFTSLTFDGTAVYVRVHSEAVVSTPSAALSVKHLSGALFAVPTINFSMTGSVDLNITVPATNPAGGAFNILDVMTNGYEFLKHLSGSFPPIPLDAYWEIGNAYGTYYCTGCAPGNGIFISNDPTDTDEYDDDVLYHEFGHFVAANLSRDDSPGGFHALSSNDLDLRLSWSEGWGDFFSGAIKTWLWSDPASRERVSGQQSSTMQLTRYVDTVPGGITVSFNFGNPPDSSSYHYATNESAVAKILFDLQANFTVQPIWDVISGFNISTPATPVNLETFWDAWYTVRSLASNTTERTTVTSFYAARSISYQPDLYESDDSLVSAAIYTIGVSAPQTRTLYSSAYPFADIDVVTFPCTTGNVYTVTTSNMLNGADTSIEVRDLSGIVVASNDNANSVTYVYAKLPSDLIPTVCDSLYPWVCHENRSDLLGSHVSFVAPAAGIYSVRIQSSSFKPLSAGRYGTYTLSITSP